MELILATPRGFCAGVTRAIEIVEKAIIKYGRPIYVRHEIVHNQYVVNDLKNKGAIFIDDVNDVPIGSHVIFSAHGVSIKIEEESLHRNLSIIDATCPLVTKVHIEAQRAEKNDRKIILIGHHNHPEVEGTSGRVKQEVYIISNVDDVAKIPLGVDDNISYITQTTLSVDDTKSIIFALKSRFPNIEGPNINNICYATQNRQNAVRELAKKTDLILVIGAVNSS
ncbi:MAG: 4-hydroxy-3-methylbut-2-enyl diphosphate reductase, partial [Rickettsiales bacterium]